MNVNLVHSSNGIIAIAKDSGFSYQNLIMLALSEITSPPHSHSIAMASDSQPMMNLNLHQNNGRRSSQQCLIETLRDRCKLGADESVDYVGKLIMHSLKCLVHK